MDVFGDAWRGHVEKIGHAWRSVVSEEDLVLVPGDISWAMKLDDAIADLAYIGRLPGKKILLRGNHDYWWSAIGRVRTALPPGMRALQNDAFLEGNVGICGSRGWLTPGSANFSADDEKIYRREIDRLKLSLQALPEAETKIAMMHFPPFCERARDSEFTDLFEKSGVDIVVYGHLHGEANKHAFEGERNGIVYHCVAADKLNFIPKRIL
jgi:predicted phosphohydrolase